MKNEQINNDVLFINLPVRNKIIAIRKDFVESIKLDYEYDIKINITMSSGEKYSISCDNLSDAEAEFKIIYSKLMQVPVEKISIKINK